MKKLLLALILLTAATARANVLEIEGQRFQPTARAADQTLQLQNAGLLKMKLIFKVYAAALYLPDSTQATNVLADIPKRLEIAYLRDIPKSVIIQAAEDHLRAAQKPEHLAALRARLDAINKLYTDIKEGDRYTLTYHPSTGCELALNGKPLGTIPGSDFAAAYYDIWLGPTTAAPALRDALLKPR